MKNFGKVLKKGVKLYIDGFNRTSAMYVNANDRNLRAIKF